MNRAEFSGPVKAGGRYVLVDDVTTMGSTLADLAAYIQRNGGHVAGSVLMVNAARDGKIDASPKVINQLEARHGQAIRDTIGIGASQLTGPEAQYLIGFKSADELRNRAAKAEQERVARLRSKEILSGRSHSEVASDASAAQAPGGDVRFLRAWHGTPYRGIENEGFKLNKIGTGEGAQVYGHGIYFAGARDVAENYRRTLTTGLTLQNHETEPAATYAARLVKNWGSEQAAKNILTNNGEQQPTGRRLEFLKAIEDGSYKNAKLETTGQLYSAEVPDDNELLDWDKPLSEQPEGVRKALTDAGVLQDISTDARIASYAKARGMTLDQARDFLAEHPETLRRMKAADGDPTGHEIYNALAKAKGGSAQNASEYLNSNGIPGLRYLDGNSRTAGDGTRNYVIWDESRLNNDIQAHYSRAADLTARSADAASIAPKVQGIVDAVTSRWKNAPEVVVVKDMGDPKVPKKVRDEDAAQRSQGATGSPEGFFHDGKVWIVAGEFHAFRESPIELVSNVMRVMQHEGDHYGLHGHFGAGLDSILNQIADVRRAEIITKARDYGLHGLDEEREASNGEVWRSMSQRQRMEAAEEVLVDMAQTQPELGFVWRAAAAIRTWLRDNVPGLMNLRMTDDEIIRNFILPARRFVEQGPEQASVGGRLAAREDGIEIPRSGEWAGEIASSNAGPRATLAQSRDQSPNRSAGDVLSLAEGVEQRNANDGGPRFSRAMPVDEDQQEAKADDHTYAGYTAEQKAAAQKGIWHPDQTHPQAARQGVEIEPGHQAAPGDGGRVRGHQGG